MTNYENRDNNNNRFQDSGEKAQLFIAKGRNDGMDAESLVEFVSSQTQIDAQEISNVKILDAFSFFAVSHDDAEIILDYFQSKAGEGRPLVSRAKRKNSGSDGRDGRRDYNNNRNGGGYGNDRRDDRGGYRSYGNNDNQGFGGNRRSRNDKY
jgi:hypothetical protein